MGPREALFVKLLWPLVITLRENGYSWRHETSYEQTANGCKIMLLNSPGGSTLQWDTGRSVLCLVSLVLIIPCFDHSPKLVQRNRLYIAHLVSRLWIWRQLARMVFDWASSRSDRAAFSRHLMEYCSVSWDISRWINSRSSLHIQCSHIISNKGKVKSLDTCYSAA